MYYSSPLSEAKLIRRYKRFLAECELPDGRVETLYCPNTGAMTHCADPGARIWYSRSDNIKRKHSLTWEQSTDAWGHRVGIHSSLANRLVAEALETGCLAQLELVDERFRHSPWLGEIGAICQESRLPQANVRLDFSLTTPAGEILVEVKSVTLHEGGGLGSFPDAVTARGFKQVDALSVLVGDGARAMLVYCVQHSGIECFRLAEAVDPVYAKAVRAFQRKGGRVLVIGSSPTVECNTIDRYIPWITS